MLGEKIKDWSVWKILVIFNLMAYTIFFPVFILFDIINIDGFIYHLIVSIFPSLNSHIYLSYQWIPAIIPLVILFISFKYSLRKLGKVEQNAKLNKVGKILFGVGIIAGGLIWFFDKITEWIVYTIKPLYILAYYTSGLSILFIPFLIILTGTSLWVKSNFGGKNTFKIFLIAIGSLIFQLILWFICLFIYDLF